MLQQFRSQIITWDKANMDVYENIYANSGDTKGRKLVVQVLNNNIVEDITGAVLSLAWNSKANGTQGLDAFTEIDASEGLFEIYYTTGMLTNVGKLKASLVLVDVNGRIESKGFDIVVSKSSVDDDAIQSENSFTALTEALVKVSQIQAEIDDIKEDIVNQGDELIAGQQERFDDLHEAKESELNDLRDSKESQLDSLYSDKESDFNRLYNDKETELNTLHQNKESALEDLEDDFSKRAENLEETYAPRLTGVENDIKGLDDEVDNVKTDIENIITIGQRYPVPLVNGWTGELWYRLNDLHQVYIYGHMTSGDMSSGGIVAEFPDEFSFYSIVPLTTYSSGRGESVIGFYISTQKTLIIRHPVAGRDSISGVRVSTLLPLRRL